MNFFREVKKHCKGEFEQYHNCLDKSSPNLAYGPCRKTQAAFDNCMIEKMSIERPHWGYYTRSKVHDSARPKHVDPLLEEKEWPNQPDKLPEDFPKPQAKYGSRWYFMT